MLFIILGIMWTGLVYIVAYAHGNYVSAEERAEYTAEAYESGVADAGGEEFEVDEDATAELSQGWDEDTDEDWDEDGGLDWSPEDENAPRASSLDWEREAGLAGDFPEDEDCAEAEPSGVNRLPPTIPPAH